MKLRRALVLLAALPLLGGVVGCASLPHLPDFSSQQGGGDFIRPDASPEYDYVVGNLFELEGKLGEASAAYVRALEKDPDSIFLVKKLAELEARQNQPERAVAYAERALTLDPGDPTTRVFLATLLRVREQPERAATVLRDDDGNPVSREAALLLYSLLMDAERLDEALATARWLREAEPDSPRGIFAMAAVLHKMDRTTEAEQILREALEPDVQNVAIYHAIARLRKETGDREGEIAVYRESLEVEPEHRATLAALVDAFISLDRVDEAIEVLERIEEHHPRDYRATVRLGFLYFEERDYAKAADRFERMLEFDRGQAEIAYFLGVSRRRLDEGDRAIEVFSSIPGEDERYADARVQIAGIYEDRDDVARAIAEVEKARTRQPSRQLDLYLASLRAKAGDFGGAVAFLEALLDKNSEDAEVFYSLGVIYGEARRMDDAIRYMQLALGIDEAHAGALNYVGYSWAERGHNLDQAEEYITRALELRPEDGYITDSLGWVFYMRAQPLLEEGELERARALLKRAAKKLERAAELTGGDPVISEHLGDVYLLLRDRDEALAKYREAIELGPREAEQPEIQQKFETLRKELQAR